MTGKWGKKCFFIWQPNGLSRVCWRQRPLLFFLRSFYGRATCNCRLPFDPPLHAWPQQWLRGIVWGDESSSFLGKTRIDNATNSLFLGSCRYAWGRGVGRRGRRC